MAEGALMKKNIQKKHIKQDNLPAFKQAVLRSLRSGYGGSVRY